MPPAVHGAHRRRAQVCRERRKVHGPVGLQGDGDRVPPRIERHREGAGGGAGLAARVRRPVHRAHDVVVLPGDRRCAGVEEGEPDRLADGVREVDAPGARPPEDPEEVHDADGERGLPRDQDILVTWEPPFAISIVDFFRVFRGTSPRGIDLANPIGETIGLSFLDPGAAAVPGEHYYVVRSVNGTANASSETSPTAGAFTVSLDAGWNAISIPLEPYGAMDLAALQADLGATAVDAMDGGGRGVGSPPPSPPTFLGFPGSMIGYDEGFGFSASLAGSLHASVAGVGDVVLEWARPGGPVDHYCVSRSDTRDGFHAGTAAGIGCPPGGGPGHH